MSQNRVSRGEVVTLPPDATCQEAAQRMRDEKIGCVVIAEAGRPLGIVTNRDLVVRVMARGRDPEKLEVRTAMTANPAFLSGERSLDQSLDAQLGDEEGRPACL